MHSKILKGSTQLGYSRFPETLPAINFYQNRVGVYILVIDINEV